MGERPGPSEQDRLGPNNPAQEAAARDARRPFEDELQKQGASMTLRQRQAMREAGDRAARKALDALQARESPERQALVQYCEKNLDLQQSLATILSEENLGARRRDAASSSGQSLEMADSHKTTAAFQPTQDMYDIALIKDLLKVFGKRSLEKELQLPGMSSPDIKQAVKQTSLRINEGMSDALQAESRVASGIADTSEITGSPAGKIGALLQKVGKGEYSHLVALFEMTRRGTSERMTREEVEALNQYMAKRHKYGTTTRSRATQQPSWDVIGLDGVLAEQGVLWSEKEKQYKLAE